MDTRGGIAMRGACQDLLERAAQENVIHGYVLAAGQRERLLLRAAGGRLGGAGSPPVTGQTRYDLDGLTQAMVALPLTLLAVENGLLCLDDPVSLYLKAPADKGALTLRHLLTHTGGLEPGFLLEQEARSDKDALRALLAHPLSGEPGKRVRYSGMGFLLLGRILEQVYQSPLDAAARKHVFAPLGMGRTGYLPTGGDIAFTDTDTVTGEPRVGVPVDENTRFLHGVSGAAGVFSDIADCCRFLSMLACQGRTGERMFLTREAVRLLAADHTQGMKEAWGLGFQLAGRETAFLGDLWPAGGYGLTAATGAALAVEPASGVYVALLANRVQMAHEGRAYQRLLRLVFSSALSEALRAEAEM